MKQRYATATSLFALLLLLFATSCRQTVSQENHGEILATLEHTATITRIYPDSVLSVLDAVWHNNERRLTSREKQMIFEQRCIINIDRHELDAAEAYCLRALKFANEADDPLLIASSLITSGVVETAREKQQKAIDFYRQALALLNELDEEHQLLITIANLNIAVTYVAMGQTNSALYSVQTALVNAINEQERYELLLAQKKKDIQHARNRIIFLSVVLSLVITAVVYCWLKTNQQHLQILSQKEEEIRRIVQQYEAYLKDKQEAQQQNDASLVKQSESEKLASALQHLFETEKVYRQQGLSVDEVTKTLNTNSKYLSNAIKKHFQKGFVEYVNTFRVEEAIEMLKEQKKGGKYAHYSIEMIAETAGFGNRASFYATFKRIVGITPREYMEILNQQTKKMEKKVESLVEKNQIGSGCIDRTGS